MRRPEVPIAFGLGVGLALASLAYLAFSPRKADLLILLTAEIVGGREVSIPAGLARGLAWPEIALAVSFIELTSLFLLFPLLVGIVEAARELHERRLRRQAVAEGHGGVAAGLHKVRWLEGALARAQAYARRNPDVDILALGALTLMPLLPIGALTSVLVGEMLRLPARWLLPTLAAALIAANVSIAWAMARLLALLPRPELVAGAMALLLLAIAGVAFLAHRRR